MRAFARRYGASPLHLLGHIAAFAVCAYAFAQVVTGGAAINFAVWFAGAAILHDLVFLPLYSLLDRIAHGWTRRIHRSEPAATHDRRVPLINHLRVPALISGLLLLVYFPLILGPARRGYVEATGHDPRGYARNWLLITATLFVGSALLYAVRVRLRARHG